MSLIKNRPLGRPPERAEAHPPRVRRPYFCPRALCRLFLMVSRKSEVFRKCSFSFTLPREHHPREGQSRGVGVLMAAPVGRGVARPPAGHRSPAARRQGATAKSEGTWEGLPALWQVNGPLGTRSPGRSWEMGTSAGGWGPIRGPGLGSLA